MSVFYTTMGQKFIPFTFSFPTLRHAPPPGKIDEIMVPAVGFPTILTTGIFLSRVIFTVNIAPITMWHTWYTIACLYFNIMNPSAFTRMGRMQITIIRRVLCFRIRTIFMPFITFKPIRCSAEHFDVKPK